MNQIRINAKDLEGQDIELSQADIEMLRTSLRGKLILPDDASFDEIRSIWNSMIDRKPAFIVRCVGVADVITSVNFARTHNLALSIKGGGHNISGLAVVEGGLMIDMSPMKGVWVDPVTRTARAQAGCLLGDLDRETQLYGLAAVLGFISNTGIAGLTLGGGFGYLTRKFGWTSDNVRSMDMVTAEGRLVHASETENSDLFWALRGGGGNFGVVTSFEYKLLPVGPDIIGGLIAWQADEAPNVLKFYKDFTENAPKELTVAVALRMAPNVPWLPEVIHAKPIVQIILCYSGEIEKGQKLITQIKSFRSPIGDIIQPRRYVNQQSILDATQPKGRRYYWKSNYLSGLNQELFTEVINHASQIVSPYSAIILFPVDGALNQLPNDFTPMGNRNATSNLNITAAWEGKENDKQNINWAQSAWQDMNKLSTGGSYINFQTEDEGEGRIRAAYGSNYGRLVDVKTKWDPGNLFRTNKNIKPKT